MARAPARASPGRADVPAHGPAYKPRTICRRARMTNARAAPAACIVHMPCVPRGSACRARAHSHFLDDHADQYLSEIVKGMDEYFICRKKEWGRLAGGGRHVPGTCRMPGLSLRRQVAMVFRRPPRCNKAGKQNKGSANVT